MSSLTVVCMSLGWVGAALSLTAYALVSTKRVAPDSLRYQGMNILACVLLGAACLATSSWPSLATNMLFLLVGVRMAWTMRHRLADRARRLIAPARRPTSAPAP